VQAHGFGEQYPDGGASTHAVTTPRIQPLQEIWAKPKAEWSAELHGFRWSLDNCSLSGYGVKSGTPP